MSKVASTSIQKHNSAKDKMPYVEQQRQARAETELSQNDPSPLKSYSESPGKNNT